MRWSVLSDNIFCDDRRSHSVSLVINKKPNSVVSSTEAGIDEHAAWIDVLCVYPRGVDIRLKSPWTMLRSRIGMTYPKMLGVCVLRTTNMPASINAIHRNEQWPTANYQDVSMVDELLQSSPCIRGDCRTVRQNQKVAICDTRKLFKLIQVHEARAQRRECLTERSFLYRSILDGRKVLFVKDHNFGGKGRGGCSDNERENCYRSEKHTSHGCDARSGEGLWFEKPKAGSGH